MRTKNRKRQVMFVRDSGEDKTDYEHTILKVKLRSTDEWYVLDFAGAQYGFFEPVIPVMHCEASHIRMMIFLIGSEYFGATKDEMVKRADEADIIGGALKMNAMTSKYLMKGAETWEKQHSLTISALLRSKDKEFDGRREGLIAEIDNWVSDCVEVLKEQAVEIKGELAARTLRLDGSLRLQK